MTIYIIVTSINDNIYTETYYKTIIIENLC